jgi:hypothetical protein
VTALGFSPDSATLAAQTVGFTGFAGYAARTPLERVAMDRNWSRRLFRWEVRTGRLLADGRALPGGESRLLGLVGSQRRPVIASLHDGETVIRHPRTLRAIRRFGVVAPVAALSPTGLDVAFGFEDGSLRLLDLRTGEVVVARGRHEGSVTALRFNPDGRALLSAGRDERLIRWDVSRAVAVEFLAARGRGLLADLAVAPDARTAYSAARDGTCSPGTSMARGGSSAPSAPRAWPWRRARCRCRRADRTSPPPMPTASSTSSTLRRCA